MAQSLLLSMYVIYTPISNVNSDWQQYFFPKKSINPRFTTQFILEAASFILSNNSVTFDEMFCLLIKGIAMGTIFAPAYATLSMDFHEIEPYAIIRNKFTLPISNYFEQNWKRLFIFFIFHIFKIKFNRAKRITRCFKQY